MEIVITESMIQESIKYAEEGWEFLITRFGEPKKEHKRNMFVGHLTELIGNEYLTIQGYDFIYPTRDIIKEKGVDDEGDYFVRTPTGEITIDAKSASEHYHTKILVPHDQYEKENIDIYLGIKLEPQNESKPSIYPTFDKMAKICGWTYHHELEKPNKASSHKFPAYWKELKRLRSLKELDELIRPIEEAGTFFK